MECKKFKHAFSVKELFRDLDQGILNNLWVRNRYKDKKILAEKIFCDCFFDILLDIINNNTTFVLPLRFGAIGELFMKQYADEEFKKLYKIGKFKNIDFVLSQFTGNTLAFRYGDRTHPIKQKPIYVNRELKTLIEKYTNEGKQYY